MPMLIDRVRALVAGGRGNEIDGKQDFRLDHPKQTTLVTKAAVLAPCPEPGAVPVLVPAADTRRRDTAPAKWARRCRLAHFIDRDCVVKRSTAKTIAPARVTHIRERSGIDQNIFAAASARDGKRMRMAMPRAAEAESARIGHDLRFTRGQ